MKKALITGVTGQDGAYLSEFLLKKGYKVYGIKRRTSLINTSRIDHIFNNNNFKLLYGDMTDSLNIVKLIKEINPDEIYNLAAMSHVAVSFQTPEYTANTDALGTLRILEAVKILEMQEKVRIYQASTSELFGKVLETPQNEKTPFYPRSPYAVAKMYAYWITVNYREAYGIYASNGILFNHESPLRGETFVTRKITIAVSKIVLGLQDCLEMGNLNSKRDWGHAKDYVEVMWKILQHDKADDWVISTGQTHSVRDFIKLSFSVLGVSIEFNGKDLNEIGIVKECKNPELKLKVGQIVVRINKKYFRPTEVDLLLGDSSKARKELGWVPNCSFEDIVSEMTIADFDLTKKYSEIN